MGPKILDPSLAKEASLALAISGYYLPALVSVATRATASNINHANSEHVNLSSTLKIYKAIYKFTIYYTLRKENGRADALSKKNDYIEIEEIFNYSILKINKDKLLLVNKYKLNIILYIIKDN